jgi:hypothetical protein
MLYLLSITDVIRYTYFKFHQVLNLVYELSEDGTDMPKHVGELKYHIFKRVCNLCTVLVS